MNPDELIALVKGHTVFIQTHNFPDPDAISSAFGLQQFLSFHGIASDLCYDGRIDRINAKKMMDTFGIQMLSHSEISKMKPEDYIILVDSQKKNSNVTNLIGNEVACIDHHPTYVACKYLYRDIRMTGSCATIIASYYQKTGTPITPEAAAALAYGIKMDTADFTRGATSMDTEMFSYLFSNANWCLLKSMYSNTLEFDDLRAYGAAIQNIKIFGTTGFAHIPFDCAPALVAIISDFILALDVVDIAVIYAMQKDGIRFSVRSERYGIHAGELTASALRGLGNGGGHSTMAGGIIPKSQMKELGNNIHANIHQLFLAAENGV